MKPEELREIRIRHEQLQTRVLELDPQEFMLHLDRKKLLNFVDELLLTIDELDD